MEKNIFYLKKYVSRFKSGVEPYRKRHQATGNEDAVPEKSCADSKVELEAILVKLILTSS